MKPGAPPQLHLESLHDANVARWLRAEKQLAQDAARKPHDRVALVAAEAAAAELYAAVRHYALVSPHAAWRALSKSEGPEAASAILSMLPPLLLPPKKKKRRSERASPQRKDNGAKSTQGARGRNSPPTKESNTRRNETTASAKRKSTTKGRRTSGARSRRPRRGAGE